LFVARVPVPFSVVGDRSGNCTVELTRRFTALRSSSSSPLTTPAVGSIRQQGLAGLRRHQ